MSGTFITDLPQENDPNLFYRIKVECFPKNLTITIIHDKTAYKGEIADQSIAEQSKVLNISEKEYLVECENAFKNSFDPNLYSFALKDEQFFIKKRLKPASSIKVKFGVINLKQVDFLETLTDMLDVSLHQNQNYIQEIEKLRADNNVLNEGNQLVLEQLENLQREKNNMENIMYSQFLKLLNSKKEEITKLRHRLGMEVDEDEDTDCEEEMDIQSIKTEEVYELDTDVDEPKEELSAVPQPSTSSENKHEYVEKKKFNIKEFLNSNKEGNKETGTSNVQNILNAMSFLDPTVPYVA